MNDPTKPDNASRQFTLWQLLLVMTLFALMAAAASYGRFVLLSWLWVAGAISGATVAIRLKVFRGSKLIEVVILGTTTIVGALLINVFAFRYLIGIWHSRSEVVVSDIVEGFMFFSMPSFLVFLVLGGVTLWLYDLTQPQNYEFTSPSKLTIRTKELSDEERDEHSSKFLES